MRARSYALPAQLKPKFFTIALVAGLLAFSGILLVMRYGQMELERDTSAWQDKLNLIADSRASAVNDWVSGHVNELKKLADNPSLQLYFSELTSLSPEGDTAEPAQKTYLRNLLIFTADRAGFMPKNVPLSAQLPADVPYSAEAGIAVLDNANHIVVGTPYLTGLDAPLQQRLHALPPAASSLIDLYRNASGTTELGFAVPVFPIQAAPGTAPVGRIVGLRAADDALFGLLRHPGITEKTLRAELLEPADGDVLFLSPPADSTAAPLEKRLRADGSPAEAMAAQHPGGFVEAKDYRGRSVLMTARAINGTPWLLAVKIDRAEALAATAMRTRAMMLVLFLVLGVVVAVVVAIWYVASSRRAIVASQYFQELAARAEAKGALLKLVTDNQPELVYILDTQHRYRFANANALYAAAMHSEKLDGKFVSDVMGPARAEPIIEACNDALTHRAPQMRIKRVKQENGNEELVVKTSYVPIAHIPIAELPEPTPGVLVVEQDISEVVHEREQRLSAQRDLIDTLITIVDRRDPHAANHSALVAQLAYAVAQSMQLGQPLCETARIAGSLMNIGKVVVPEAVLTKRDSLSEQERRIIRDSMLASADLLKGVAFEGPVVETLRQAYEHWDGTGQLGLKGEDILVTARIIAVVNTFVGMVSPRAWRAAMSLTAATRLLLERIDTQFDRKVVFALVDYLENHEGRALLEKRTPQKLATA